MRQTQEESPPEAAYQKEFYASLYRTIDGAFYVSPEFSSAKGFRKGRIDFFIPSEKWGVELLRDGSEPSEHSSQFDDIGDYGVWLPTAEMLDYIILDFRLTKPIRAHLDSKSILFIRSWANNHLSCYSWEPLPCCDGQFRTNCNGIHQYPGSNRSVLASTRIKVSEHPSLTS
jgi:hypothetical protein